MYDYVGYGPIWLFWTNYTVFLAPSSFLFYGLLYLTLRRLRNKGKHVKIYK